MPDDLVHPAPWQWNYDPRLGDNAYRGGRGWTALGSDIERIPRQQYFLRTLAQVAINRTDDNPLRIVGLVDAVMTHLTTDQSLTLDELKSLVNTFHRLRPADVEMTTIPWSPDPSNPGARLVVKYPDAQALLFRLANFMAAKPFLPALVDPRTVRVRVVDGSGVPGLGARALHELVTAGFRANGPVLEAGGAAYARTQVRWSDGLDAQGVTAVYATGATQSGQAASATDTAGADVLVVVGRDWDTLRRHMSDPGTSSAPTTVATSTSTGAGTTATTIANSSRNYTPVDPKTGGVLVGCPAA